MEIVKRKILLDASEVKATTDKVEHLLRLLNEAMSLINDLASTEIDLNIQVKE